MKKFPLTTCLFVLVGASTIPMYAAVIANPGFTTNVLPANDDGFTGLVPVGFNLNFFGTTYSGLYVNNNGNVTFASGYSTFTPTGISGVPQPIIAPFFADVDTRGAGSSPVTYGTDTVGGRAAFGVNWVDVGYFNAHDDKLNQFQLVLIDRSDINPGDFDIQFNYGDMLWETGDVSGGSGGLGGTSAAVGYSNGAGSYQEVIGSLVAGSFVGQNGLTGDQINFTVRNGVVAGIPEPGSVAALGCVLVSGLLLRTRRSKA